MSYGSAAALQAGLYQLLSDDADVAALVGAAIYDDVPPGADDETFVTIGVEDARDASDKTGRMAEHRVTVRVTTRSEGFAAAKAVAAAVGDALIDARPVLARGRIVALHFQRARARFLRSNRVRQVDLTFRALLDDA